MADEPQGQQAQSSGVTAMNAPIPEPAPAPAEPTPTPQQSGGPTVEDLSREMEDLRRQNAEYADRAARAEHDAAYTRNLIETFRQPVNQPAAPAQPEITDDEFLQNPGKAMSKLIDAKFAQEKAEREREKQVAYVERAKDYYEEGARLATEKYGKLMSGIEVDVRNQVREAVINQQLPPEAARNPKVWAMTALAMRFEKEEASLDKYLSNQRSPMTPPHTETPTAAAPPKVSTTLSPEQEEAIARANITREQFLASMEKVRAAQQERSR